MFPGEVALSWAQGQSHAPTKAVGGIAAGELRIPEAAGYVVETHMPAETTERSPVVIQIQEAHTNQGAQQSIITILEQLIQRHGLRLILIEGGTGSASLSHLRRHATLAHRKEVAARYLQAGLLSGEEYVDLTSEAPLVLWGVEDPALYEQNVELFLQALKVREAQQPALQALREAADGLRPALLSAALNALMDQADRFQRRELSVADYAQGLQAAAEQHGVAAADYPNVQRYFALRKLEGAVAAPEAQREQRRLMADLSAKLPEAEVEALLKDAAAVKAGTAADVTFYRAVEAAARQAGLEIAAYPKLAHYIHYVKESTQINATVLAEELEGFAAALRAALAQGPAAQQLVALRDATNLFEKLLRLDLSPAEYERLQRIDFAATWPAWDAFLRAERARAGLSAQPLAETLRRLEAELPVLWRFYEVARLRDERLVANAVEQLQQRGEPLAVLITGGFHGPRITELLKARGIATVLMVPKVGQPTDERLYQAILRYKSGRGGSFEEVMALADQLAAKP